MKDAPQWDSGKALSGTQRNWARVRCLIALEGMGKVMLVVHVALCAEVIVKADTALPTHATKPMFLAAVTDDVGVADTCTPAWGSRSMVRGVVQRP